MYILGISAFYHDSAACLIKNGTLLGALQEERLSRIKNDPSFPSQAVRTLLEQHNVNPDEIKAIVFYDKPFVKFERLIETIHATAPKSYALFMKAMPPWVREKLFTKQVIKKELRKLGFPNPIHLYFSEHHLSHAASTFYPSPFNDAAILTVDGVGEWATTSLAIGNGRNITLLKEIHFPHSLGLFYSAFTYYLGFKVNSGEYKLMGLAPYGNTDSQEVKQFVQLIYENILKKKEDSSFFLNQHFFKYCYAYETCHETRWKKLFGFSRRAENDPIEQHHCDLALACQKVTEEVLLNLAQHLKELTNAKNLVLAGGVALNCVANKKLLAQSGFDNVWIQPAAGDAGGALGAAFAYWHLGLEKKRESSTNTMMGSAWGPQYSDDEIEEFLKINHLNYQKLSSEDELLEKSSNLILDGNVLGWFQGRLEWGPRALGHRSILADARNLEMQKKLNLKIKFREGFRPFAPSILQEDTPKVFNHPIDSPYMLFTDELASQHQIPKPEGYSLWSVNDKLKFKRSQWPAITHIDYSARLQTVTKENNPLYYQLLKKIQSKIEIGVVINTSFNVRGEPIVCHPQNAIDCFLATDMDALSIGSFLVLKRHQKLELQNQPRRQFIQD